MRALCIVSVLVALSACATAETALVDPQGRVEVGYAPGSLGFAAIMRGDFAGAESLIAAQDSKDPAQLLNLAHIYRKTGREREAQRLYQQVAAMPQNIEVELADGDIASSRELALKALGMNTGYASLR
jgi:Tfp pilus assembly protein PilF